MTAAVCIRRAYVDGPVGQLHYRRAGKPDAPLLVLLHQTPSHSAMYEPLMRRLADRYDVLALDTPGFGQSDPLPGDFSIAAAAQVLAVAVARLRPGPAFWFGHHTGAALALQAAVAVPRQVRALALSGPCLLDQGLRARLPQLAAFVPPREDGSHLATLWQRIVAKDGQAPLALRQREVLAGLAAGEIYAQAYQAVVEVDTAAQLRALRCPALVLAGTEDPLYPQLDAAFRLLANGRKAEIAGARTFICELQDAAVADLLDGFFGGPDV